MPVETNDKVISKANSGFPPYLDFTKLRSEGIDYLGQLAGKIWTDHNVHDPGITILEELCYALLDLGYRTNLPAEDIFSKDAESGLPENNFLTPAQILGCNPLTITDFRKLLVDIKGVRNAWLEIATDFDVEHFCREHNLDMWQRSAPDSCCAQYLNGLYHVLLELEASFEEELGKDTGNKKKEAFVKKIKTVLAAHRNICEDFIDIRFLCKWPIGVCAEIELEPNADAEKVYLEMVEKLKDFFTPAPRFYTLPQMLEKNKSMEEVFAGRPLDITESHGFIDTEELEQLTLRKAIHVSDVYQVLFQVKGISNVQRLRLLNCSDPKSLKEDKWSVSIPQNHVPEYNISCSGFQFTKSGMPLSFNFKKYEAVLQINSIHTARALYQLPSANLDAEIPKGVYRKDLGDYYSIQNDFPRVYGIAEGGLPADAPPLRKAQALQLKSYLLFFDQLLVNYLSQLKNIRTLFALSTPESAGVAHTYFVSQPDTVPALQKLIRFQLSEDSETGQNEGRVLAIPVQQNQLQSWIDNDLMKDLDIEAVEPYVFHHAVERDVVVNQLNEDFFNDVYTAQYIIKNNDCVFFYLFTTIDGVALLGRQYFSNEKEASVGFATLNYAAATVGNYTAYRLPGQELYSFEIELKQTTYVQHLQRLVEDETTYQERRESFLNHLLARFAETFTDYALLNYGFHQTEENGTREIKAKELFLKNYPELSSNRGKACDYLADGWNTNNVAGMEKRFQALTGAEYLGRQSLCNFEVYEKGRNYTVVLKLGQREFFKSTEKFSSPEEAQTAARALFAALKDRNNYFVEAAPALQSYQICVLSSEGQKAVYTKPFPAKATAVTTADRLYSFFSRRRGAEPVEVADYQYTPVVENSTGQVLRTLKRSFASEQEARAAAWKSVTKINNRAIWEPSEGTEQAISRLHYEAENPDEADLIDIEKFRFDINNTIVGKPELFTYDLLDNRNRFKLRSLNEFLSRKQARDNAIRLLHLLRREENYRISTDKDEKRANLFISNGDTLQAVDASGFGSEEEAMQMKAEILRTVQGFSYALSLKQTPFTWRFKQALGYEPDETFTIKSVQLYPSREEAAAAGEAFARDLGAAKPEVAEGELMIKSGNGPHNEIRGVVLRGAAAGETQNAPAEAVVARLLQEVKDVEQLEKNEAAFAAAVQLDEASLCPYAYRLVDKDKIYAFFKGGEINNKNAEDRRRKVASQNPEAYNIPRLYLGGNIVVEVKDEDQKTNWYHYQLRTINAIFNPGNTRTAELVLFESVKGYRSREEAENAFAASYLHILKLALKEENYGEQKAITTTIKRIHAAEECPTLQPLVFIPKDTLEFVGIYPGSSLDSFIRIIKGYPIRSLAKKRDCKEFYQYFPLCEEDADACQEDPAEECSPEEEKPVYFFVLYDKYADREIWQSAVYYESLDLAMQEFRFFLLLLKYEGNYTVDCSCRGEYRIIIREVLAESVDRFLTPALAWGKEGVEKFIQVTQTGSGFHAYVDTDCCHRFFVACENIHAVHPCRYDYPEQRDRVLEQLRQAAGAVRNWSFEDWWSQTDLQLLDFEGRVIADMEFSDRQMYTGPSGGPKPYPEVYMTVIQSISNSNLCLGTEEVYLADGSIRFRLVAGSDVHTPAELRQKLLWLVHFFPFTNDPGQQAISAAATYCVEIKLPGFNNCESGLPETSSAPEHRAGTTEYCPVAWKDLCCYTNWADALHSFERLQNWINETAFYRKVFDCVCASYGIALYDEARECVKENSNTQYGEADFRESRIRRLNREVARNPQCYSSAEMVCDAIGRAKQLSNREGLHLVEHILLRPTQLEDCRCRVWPCSNEFSACSFPYWNDLAEKDPCNEQMPVCFVPGYDPYSFIATVLVPAWPERFQKPENRIILENIIHREVPAHVLVRILWLTPHDLCCFEDLYKKWLQWSAYGTSCEDVYSNCHLLDFLFRRPFECLREPDACDRCEEEQPDVVDCMQLIQGEEKNRAAEKKQCQQSWLQQVNELYCWTDFECNGREFIDCDGNRWQQPGHDEGPVDNVPERIEGVPAMPEAPTAHHVPEHPERSFDRTGKPKFVNTRLATYRKNVDAIVAALKEKEPGVKCRRFLDTSAPTAKEYNKLVMDLLSLLKPKEQNKKVSSRKKIHDLIANATWYFLDKWCFDGQAIETLEMCSNTWNAMRKAKINTVKLYHDWGPQAVQKYEPEIELHQVEKFFLK